MSKVRIPTPLRKYTGGSDEVMAAGKTLREVLENLGAEHDGIRERICEPDGKLKRFVNVFLNDEDVRYLSGLETPVKDEDVVSIVPAIAGGGRDRTAGR